MNFPTFPTSLAFQFPLLLEYLSYWQAGLLFVALYHGFLNGTTALLFGSFLGITSSQVALLAATAAAVLAILAAIGRPLPFASVDPDVAAARGAPAVPLVNISTARSSGSTSTRSTGSASSSSA